MSLESQEEDDDKMWLTYWAVYGVFVIFDTYTSCILGFLPHYYLIKFIFLIYLMNPSTKGSLFIYNTCLKPIFLKYKDQIQAQIDRVKNEANKIKEKGKNFVSNPDNIKKGIEIAEKVGAY